MGLFRTTTLKLELVTPMFLSGADQSRGELRAASVRGLLRFWFRATRGAEVGERNLRDEEAAMFGASAGDSGRASAVVVRMRGPNSNVAAGEEVANPGERLWAPSKLSGWDGAPKPPVNPISYLGYGPYQYKKGAGFVATRDHFAPRTPMAVDLIERFKLDDGQRRNLQRAAWCWIAFGGTGSRARKGFGSFVLADKSEGFDALAPELQRARLDDAAWNALPRQGAGLPPFTRFSAATRCFLGPPQERASEALGWLGQQYKQWRLELEGRSHRGTERGWLGAPLNIDRQNWAPSVREGSSLRPSDRRASPYFLHVTRDESGYRPVVLFLPASFAPELRDRDRSEEVGARFNELILQTRGVVELGTRSNDTV